MASFLLSLLNDEAGSTEEKSSAFMAFCWSSMSRHGFGRSTPFIAS
jgi:hypothetical protein